MVDMITDWYKQRVSDPHAASLIAILLIGFIIIYFFGHILAPVLTAIVFAYLLEWPVGRLCRLGVPRGISSALVLIIFVTIALAIFLGLIPTIWSQVGNLINDLPRMYGSAQVFILSIPERYPELEGLQLVDTILNDTKDRLITLGKGIVRHSFSSLMSIAVLGVYLILVPFLIFFLLKDKQEMIVMMSGLLPRKRKLAKEVWAEVNQQISNYIRGKAVEIVIVGTISYVVFALMGLDYSVLLAVMVGLSVLVPYVGAAVVTLPIAMVGLFQWGVSPQFYWLLISYGIIQLIDGNVLFPILFSEAVNIHPVAIIIAVVVFGGIWGFWGVFFAIPLATLVKAVWKALPMNLATDDNSDLEEE